MSNLVVFSFLSRRTSRQRQWILTRVMDRHFVLRFSTIPGEYSPRNGLEGSHRDTLPFDTENATAEMSTRALRRAACPATHPLEAAPAGAPQDHPLE